MIRFLFILLLAQNAFGYSDFYKQSKKGWFWFEEKAKDIEQMTFRSIQNFQERMESAKIDMIMNPSIESARNYIALQNEMFKKAHQVGVAWQGALRHYPELNMTRPISQIGARIADNLETKNNNAAIRNFAKKFKLLFFYKADCDFCIEFANVVEQLSLRYGFKVAAVSLDGKSLHKFPATTNKALASKFNVEVAPALFAFSDDVAVPISSGFLTLDAVTRNILFAIEELQ